MSGMAEDIALECKGLSKKYTTSGTDFWALKKVSFDLKRGEILGVIGRNGAGKSSLLKIISKIMVPSEGEIRYVGRLASIIEIGTGFHADLSGKENVYLNASLLGCKKSEIDAFYDDIVAFSGLEGYMDTPVKNYSSGMYLRLAFSIAFQSDVDILVLDEVIAVGDIDFRQKCYGRIRELSEKGVSIIIVSHNTNQIVDFCNRCLLLDQGTLLAEGLPLDVVNKYLELSASQQGIAVGSQLNNTTDSNEDPILFEANLNSLGIEQVKLERFRVFINGEETAEKVYTDDEITLQMDFEQLGSETVEFAFYLKNMEGYKVLLDAPSLRKNYEQEKLAAGKYSLTCVVPGNLLPRGIFNLGVVICKNDWVNVLGEVPNAVRIKVDVSNAYKTGYQISSALHPHLKWNMTKQKTV